MNAERRRPIVVLLLLVLGLGGLAVAWVGGPRQAVRDLLAGRALRCEQLLPLADAERVVAAHAPLFAAVRAVNPAAVTVSLSPGTACPGRVSLTISYATTRDREAIEALLAASPGHRPARWGQPPRVFGLPYRLVNV